MNSQSSDSKSENIKTVAIDWAESEWFETWIQLSRHHTAEEVKTGPQRTKSETAAT